MEKIVFFSLQTHRPCDRVWRIGDSLQKFLVKRVTEFWNRKIKGNLGLKFQFGICESEREFRKWPAGISAS